MRTVTRVQVGEDLKGKGPSSIEVTPIPRLAGRAPLEQEPESASQTAPEARSASLRGQSDLMDIDAPILLTAKAWEPR